MLIQMSIRPKPSRGQGILCTEDRRALYVTTYWNEIYVYISKPEPMQITRRMRSEHVMS